jgi:hypothetical protein
MENNDDQIEQESELQQENPIFEDIEIDGEADTSGDKGDGMTIIDDGGWQVVGLFSNKKEKDLQDVARSLNAGKQITRILMQKDADEDEISIAKHLLTKEMNLYKKNKYKMYLYLFTGIVIGSTLGFGL